MYLFRVCCVIFLEVEVSEFRIRIQLPTSDLSIVSSDFFHGRTPYQGTNLGDLLCFFIKENTEY